MMVTLPRFLTQRKQPSLVRQCNLGVQALVSFGFIIANLYCSVTNPARAMKRQIADAMLSSLLALCTGNHTWPIVTLVQYQMRRYARISVEWH